MPTGDTDAEPLNSQPEEYTEPPGSGEGVPLLRKGRQPFRSLPRELNEEELATSGVQKLILYENDRLEEETHELKEFRDRFHERDKAAALLDERTRRSSAKDIVLGAALAVGASFLGLIPSLSSSPPLVQVVIIIGAAVMVVGAVVGRLLWK